MYFTWPADCVNNLAVTISSMDDMARFGRTVVFNKHDTHFVFARFVYQACKCRSSLYIHMSIFSDCYSHVTIGHSIHPSHNIYPALNMTL